MKKLSFLLVLVFAAVSANASVNWNTINGDCYSIKEVLLPKNKQVQITLTAEELNRFNLKQARKDPLTSASAVKLSKKDGKTVATFTDLNAFVSADYLGKEKRSTYLIQNFLKGKIDDGAINWCEKVYSAALRSRLEPVIEYCVNNYAVGFDDYADYDLINTWQTWKLQFACSGNYQANRFMLVKEPDIINYGFDANSRDNMAHDHAYIKHAVYADNQDGAFCPYVIKKCESAKKCSGMLKGLYGENSADKKSVLGCMMNTTGKVTAMNDELKQDIIDGISDNPNKDIKLDAI